MLKQKAAVKAQEKDGWYTNDTIGRILHSPSNSVILCTPYTFIIDVEQQGYQRIYEFKAFFLLAEKLRRPIAVVASKIGELGNHWVLCYFIDKDNMLYVDPYGDSNDNLDDIVANLGKSVYVSKTRIQTDGNSCGPISTELAMRFQEKFFFDAEGLLRSLRDQSSDKVGCGLYNVKVDGLIKIDGVLKEKDTKTLRQRHSAFLNHNTKGEFLQNAAQDLRELIQKSAENPSAKDDDTWEMMRNTKEQNKNLTKLESQITAKELEYRSGIEDRPGDQVSTLALGDNVDSETTISEKGLELTATPNTDSVLTLALLDNEEAIGTVNKRKDTPNVIRDGVIEVYQDSGCKKEHQLAVKKQTLCQKSSATTDRKKFLAVTVACLTGLLVCSAIAVIYSNINNRAVKIGSLIGAGVFCIACIVSVVFAITAREEKVPQEKVAASKVERSKETKTSKRLNI